MRLDGLGCGLHLQENKRFFEWRNNAKDHETKIQIKNMTYKVDIEMI